MELWGAIWSKQFEYEFEFNVRLCCLVVLFIVDGTSRLRCHPGSPHSILPFISACGVADGILPAAWVERRRSCSDLITSSILIRVAFFLVEVSALLSLLPLPFPLTSVLPLPLPLLLALLLFAFVFNNNYTFSSLWIFCENSQKNSHSFYVTFDQLFF